MFPVIRNAPGGKEGRCVRLTTYHHYSAVVKKSGSLNSPGPLRACMACNGCVFATSLSRLHYHIGRQVRDNCSKYRSSRPAIVMLDETKKHTYLTDVGYLCLGCEATEKYICVLLRLDGMM